ncbi:MAG: PAS domain S-box protein [Anaerolineae bacterium]
MKSKSKTKEQLTSELVEMRQRVAELEAVSTERVRAEEALRRSLEETAHSQRLLLALSQAAQAVQRVRTPVEVYRTVGDEIARLGYHAVVFTLRAEPLGLSLGTKPQSEALTDDRAHLVLSHLTFEPALVRAAEQLTGLSAQDFRFPLVPGGYFQRIIAEGEPTLSDSEQVPESMAEALPAPVRPLASRIMALLRLEQSIIAPLTIGGETHGLLIVFGADLTEADVPAVTAFANQAATAIENARLYEEARARVRELSALTLVGEAINRALSLEEILDIVLREAMGLVGRKEGSIVLLDPRTNTMRIAASEGLPPKAVEDFNSRPVYAHEGTFGIVMETGEMLEIPDALHDSRVLHGVGKVPEQLTAVPLRTEEGVIGVIVLDALPPDDRARRLLLALGDLAAVAIRRAQLFEQEKRRATQLTLINEVGDKATAILDLDRLMQEVTRSIQESFNYYNVALFLLDEERREVVMRSVAGGFEHIFPGEYRQSFDEGIIGFVARTGNSWLANDVSEDPHYVKGFPEEVLTKSELCIPIKLGDEVIGALDVQSIRLNDFDQADVAAMEAVADQLAIAIENARFYDEVKKRAEEMAALHRIGLITTSTLDLDEVLKLIYEEVSQLMKPDTFYIALYDEQGEEINFEIYVEKGQDLGKFSRKLGEGGLTAWIIQSNQPLLIRNTAKESFPTEPLVVGEFVPELSYLGVPLVARSKVIGVISVQSFQPYALDEGDQRFLTTIADQAAIAIENARLYEAAQEELAERKRAEEALRVSEERFALAVQGANDGIWDWDIQNNSLYWSPRMKELLGYAVDELDIDFDTFDSLLHPDDREHTAAAIEAHLKKRGLYDVEQRLRTKSGEYHWFRARGQALWGEAGNPIRMIGSTSDITERKRAETEIRKLNRFLDSVIDTANVWLDVIDERGNVVLRNRAAEEISGYSREEVVGHAKIWEWLYPDEEYRNEVFARAVARIDTGERAKDVETTIRRKDGQTRVISWNSRNLVDEEGNPIGSIALGHDITERKRVEEALRDEKALMDALMDNIPDSIYFKDRQGRLIRINRKMMRDLNLDEMSQAVGKTDVDLFGEEFGRKTLAEDRRVMTTGEPIIGLIESRQLKDGQINWTLTTKVPLCDASGQIVGLVGITHEINEFMRAEEELRQLKEFNEGIVQGMEEGIMMEDAEGHITFVNPKMAEMLGYTEKELRGKHWSEIVAPSCLRQVEEESSKRLKGISTRYEALLLRKDGKEVPGLVSARPLFREGEFVGTLAVCTDLTERKEMEQQLIQAGKLAAIGQLVAGVAHELNNPLTSVVGYSQLLMGAKCSEEIKHDLGRINRQAVRAAKIVENLLTFARRREARKESININAVIERSLELQAHQLALDRISIVKELDEALPPTMADSFQMQQVFMNIISNAHQALRDWEGERQLRVRSELAEDMIHLQFTDSGPGIPAGVMERLFEPFFTTREVGEGTGLGLSISYGIVEAHGGSIWAESEVGKGATLIVEIPVRED